MLHDGLRQSGFLACNRPLAESREAFVGEDLAEDPVHASGVDDDRLQAGDLQIERSGFRAGLLSRRKSWIRKYGAARQKECASVHFASCYCFQPGIDTVAR